MQFRIGDIVKNSRYCCEACDRIRYTVTGVGEDWIQINEYPILYGPNTLMLAVARKVKRTLPEWF